MLPLAPSLLAVWLAAVCTAAEPGAAVDPGQKRPLDLQVRLDDEPITPGTARYLHRAIREAEGRDAECLIIVLDTPGGLLDSTRSIVKEMLAARTCVAVYVAPSGSRAASAGVFITLASHVAAMAPGTTIGAAHPVQVGGLPLEPSPERPREDKGEEEDSDDGTSEKKPSSPSSALEEKLVNDTVAWARELAKLRKRNSDWAAQAVEESVSVGAAEAVEQRVVELLATDLEELLEKLDGREIGLPQGPHTLRTAEAEVEEFPMWWGEQVLAILSRPNIAFLLMIFGFYGILFELYSPGWGVPGTLGLICLLLAFFGLAVLPVNYLGLVLIVVALGLFVAEVFVTSFGALTVAGIICLVLGGVMLVDSPVGFSRVSLGVVLPVAAATGLITLVLIGGIIRAHRRRVLTGDEGLIGVTVKARTDFSPEGNRYVGTVFAHGEWWKAVSDAPVSAGQECTVERRLDLSLVVIPSEWPASEN